MLRNPLAPAVLVLAGCLAADEVRLVDGRVLEGEVVSRPGADVVDLKTGSGSLLVVQHFAKHSVAEITFGESPRQKALAALGQARQSLGDGGTAEEWWALAERARELGDSILHRELAAETAQRDRAHPGARKALGMIQYRGVWMRPHEAAVARGEVLHEGRYMTWVERESAIEGVEQERQIAMQRREDRERQRQERRIKAAAAAASTWDYGVPQATWVPSYNPNANYYRAVYWPACSYPVAPIHQHSSGSGLTVSAGGSSGNFNWAFSWR